jgi:hypothetical protein
MHRVILMVEIRKEARNMQWQVIVALAIAIPIILFPVAYIWYINIGGMVAAMRRAREKRAVREENVPEHEMEYNTALVNAIKRYPWDK